MEKLPKWLYHPEQDAKIVHTQDDVDEHLSEGWAETPAAFEEDTANRDALIEEAKSLGIEPGPRWGVKRLQKAIDDVKSN
jgi:hypothetical protein